MMALLSRAMEYANKAFSNNLHNYIAGCFLFSSLVTIYVVLGMTVASWWRGLPPPPKEVFELLQLELYALFGFAGLNATAHTYKAVKGAGGANTPPVEPTPPAGAALGG